MTVLTFVLCFAAGLQMKIVQFGGWTIVFSATRKLLQSLNRVALQDLVFG